jgi:hypothetical protein
LDIRSGQFELSWQKPLIEQSIAIARQAYEAAASDLYQGRSEFLMLYVLKNGKMK